MDDFEKNVITSDFTFKTQDYELFPTMKEYINEVISPVQIYNSFGQTVIRIKSLRGGNNEDDPLLIIDGVATKNLDFLLSLDPEKIEEIRIIKEPDRLSLFSSMGRNGIILIKSYEGGLREPVDENNIVEGVQPQQAKQNPVLLKSNDAPVFDSNLYWNPQWSNTEKELRFVQTNDVGNMLIKVEGFQNGKPLSYSFVYQSTTRQGSN